MRDLFGVIRIELRVKTPTLINPRSKICSVVQLYVCVFSFFVSLIKKKKKKFVAFFLKVLHYFKRKGFEKKKKKKNSCGKNIYIKPFLKKKKKN